MKLSGEKIPEAKRIRNDNGTLMGPTHREILICYPFPQEFGPVYPKIVVLGRFLIHYCLPLLVIGTFYVVMANHLLRRYFLSLLNIQLKFCFFNFFISAFFFKNDASVQVIPGHATVRTSKRHRQIRHPSDSSASNNVKSMYTDRWYTQYNFHSHIAGSYCIKRGNLKLWIQYQLPNIWWKPKKKRFPYFTIRSHQSPPIHELKSQ
jgi:hypothetical protein